jgi:hypothetical protein
MANQQQDTFPYGLSDAELIALATKRPQVVERFDTPICLTSPDKDPVLWAIGRSDTGELMVESRSQYETSPPRVFNSFMNHAPDLAEEALQHSIFLPARKTKKIPSPSTASRGNIFQGRRPAGRQKGQATKVLPIQKSD